MPKRKTNDYFSKLYKDFMDTMYISKGKGKGKVFPSTGLGGP
jgi:hypothetical protein